MCHPTRPHPLFCILPPHIIEAVAQRGTALQRLRALRTLTTDQTFRALRVSPRATVPEVRRRLNMLAMEGQKQRTIFDARNLETLPGTVVRSEGGGPSGDPAVDEAYDGLGATYDLLRRTIGIRSMTRVWR